MLLGCTTAGEISAAGYGRGCISAVGLDLRTFAVDCTLIRALDSFSLVEAQQAVERMLGHCRQVNLAPVKDHTFALTLLDGLSSREELVLNTLSAALGSIPHFGGSGRQPSEPHPRLLPGPLRYRRRRGGDGQHLAGL